MGLQYLLGQADGMVSSEAKIPRKAPFHPGLYRGKLSDGADAARPGIKGGEASPKP
jgi:hypothetical protein